ncbi:SlyX family protein [Bartonella vinsonii]|uniref:SlyX protein n=1 Tax=Bartonella vinsonii subsp. berkhoffii str. Tweed TaxID=1094502 RepID=N6VNJ9_BARVB|nr:SlyX family protein [Bartonella vinsonii]ENN94766.1 SlyX protein [Bartonella vinsonii subsp. berkhoffii str. Tweed]
MSDENRLIELETKLAYQEKLIDELSCVVTEQWKSLNEISKKINVLMRKFSNLEEQRVSEDIIVPSSHQ